MNKDKVASVEQKFFFDQNIFDDEGNLESRHADEEPPPPVFSEEELEAAKKVAFREGHIQAAEEGRQSREQALNTILDRISRDMTLLFAGEGVREKLYEQEVIALVCGIFEKVFPHFVEQHGLSELKAATQHVLEQQSGKQAVQVSVHPEYVQDIDGYLQRLSAQSPALRFTVKGDETLKPHACKMAWEHGGAIHDTDKAAQDILGILKDGLAGKAANSHDNMQEGQETAPDAPIQDAQDPPGPDNQDSAVTGAAPEESRDE